MEDTTQQQVPQRSLVRKLSEVMALVERVPKRGRNDFHGYDYATEADIAAAVRQGLAERHCILVPSVIEQKFGEIQRKNSAGADRIATLLVEFTLHDGDSGEKISYRVMGEGQDAGDKATYKAMTGAEKYALLKIFLIPTGDDPEREPAGKPAPSGASSSQRAEKSATGGSATGSEVVRFGRDKGKTLGEVDDSGLAWLADKAAQDVAKNDPKWHAKNRAWADAIHAEQERRKKSAATSSATAPKGTSFERAVAKLDAMGVPYKAYSEKLKEWGKTRPKEVTEDDAARLIAFFSGDHPPEEPPPPGDEDAPGGAP